MTALSPTEIDPTLGFLGKPRRRDSDKFLEEMTRNIEPLGKAIVDIAGTLDGVRDGATQTSADVGVLLERAEKVASATKSVRTAVNEASEYVGTAVDRASDSREKVSEASVKIKDLAGWVQSSGDKFQTLLTALGRLEENADRISRIAEEVNILAINASIEAARAGPAGRGFAIVAAAVTELARSTSETTNTISASLLELKDTTRGVIDEGQSAFEKATEVIADTEAVDGAFAEMQQTLGSIGSHAAEIDVHVTSIDESFSGFEDNIRGIGNAASNSAAMLADVADRTNELVDLSEEIVYLHSAMGGAVNEDKAIAYVIEKAQEVGELFEQAVAAGRLSEADLFDRDYRPIAGTDPQQHMTRFTALTDKTLPPIQEAALQLSDRVVFCAAVDLNGYLPTHNRKFSQPQGQDPVWNAANSRNRRIFNDRVGLKAGRSTRPFLMQTYRRDMGGGNFVLMKDISAPIMVKGRHWGGLRLAVRF